MTQVYKIVWLFSIFTLIIFRFSGFSQELSVKLLPGEQKVFEQAVYEFESESYLSAKERFSQLLSLYPREIYFNYAYGACLVCLNTEFTKSIDYLEYALDGGMYQANYFLGMAYHLRYMFDNAIRYYEDYQQRATGKDIKLLPVDRQIKMAQNGIDLIRYSYDLQVVESKNVKTDNFYYSYNSNSRSGEIVVIPEAFKTKNDKKRNYSGLMYVSKLYNIAFFSSYGTEKKSNLDLYMVVKEGDAWSAPKKLPKIVNSVEDESFPFFHPNGEFLYFSSKGHNSMGGYDIFRVAYNRESDKWSEPENLDFPINTPLEDIMYITDDRDLTAFFASTREAEAGRIGVYQILIEKNPAQRQIANIDDVRKTSHLQINPIAVKEFEKRSQALIALNNDTASEFNNQIPDINTPSNDTATTDKLHEANTNIDSLQKRAEFYTIKNEATLSQIQQYMDEIDRLEVEKQLIAGKNIPAEEKNKQISNIDAKIYVYTDSLAVLKDLSDNYELTINEMKQKSDYYNTQITEIENHNTENPTNEKSLDIINTEVKKELTVNPGSDFLENLQKEIEAKNNQIRTNHDYLQSVERRINEIDSQIMDLNDSLLFTNDPEKQQAARKQIEMLKTERNRLVVDYKERFLQQEFLIKETRQLEKEQAIAASLVNEPNVNYPKTGLSAEIVLNKAEKYIARRDQRNLKDLAVMQNQVLDSVFFDNSTLANNRILAENNMLHEKTLHEKNNIQKIHIITESPLFDESLVNTYLATADSLGAELEHTQKMFESETNIEKRNELLNNYNNTLAELNEVYTHINDEITVVNNTIAVNNVSNENVDDIRDKTESQIAIQKEKGLSNDVILAEDYLTTADSLYAMAAEADDKLPALQDYYLKEAIIYEAKAFEITHNNLTANNQNNFNNTNQNETINSDTLLVYQPDSLSIDSIINETKQQIQIIENTYSNQNNDSIWDKTIAGYNELDEINSAIRNTSDDNTKISLQDYATQIFKETRDLHAQAAEQLLNKNLEEYLIFDKSFRETSDHSISKANTPEALDRRNSAIALHNQAANLLIAAEETTNDSLKNELIIEAAQLESQAVQEYKKAFEIAIDTNFYTSVKEPEYSFVTSNLTIDTIVSEYIEIRNELPQSNTNLQSTNEEEIVMQQIDSLLIKAENINTSIASLQTEYEKTDIPSEQNRIINEIDSLRNEQEIIVDSAYSTLVDLQQQKIRKNRDFIEANKANYTDRKKLYLEIEDDYLSYSKAISDKAYRSETNYFYLLQEIVVFGDSILAKQQQLISEKTNNTQPENKTITSRIEEIGRKMLKTDNWVAENVQRQATSFENQRNNLTVPSEAQKNYMQNSERTLTSNMHIINNNPEIKSIVTRADSAMNEAATIRKELSDNFQTYSNNEIEARVARADSLETLGLAYQNKAIELIEVDKQLAIAREDSVRYAQKEAAWNDTFNVNRNLLDTISTTSTEINSAIEKAIIVSDSLMNEATKIRDNISDNNNRFTENEKNQLQQHADSLTTAAIDLQNQAIKFSTNNDIQSAQLINSNYSYLIENPIRDSIVMTYRPISKESLFLLPENEIDANKFLNNTTDREVIDKLTKEREELRLQIKSIDEEILLVQDYISKTSNATDKTKLIAERDSLLTDRSQKVEKYLATNDDILNYSISKLEEKRLKLKTDSPALKQQADSLTKDARRKEQQADSLRIAAMQSNDIINSKSDLLAQANALDEEALSQRSEAIMILESPAADTVQQNTVLNGNNTNNTPASENVLVFRIQFAAYNRIVGDEYTKGLSPLFTEKVPDRQLIRYMTGDYPNFETAARALPGVKNVGFNDAFIVAYLNGKRITIFEANQYLAQQKVSKNEIIAVNDQQQATNQNVTDSVERANSQYGIIDVKAVEGVFLCVQFAAAKRILLPGEIFGLSADFLEFLDNGYIRHLSGKFYSMNDAANARNIIRATGANDAFITAYRNGVRIPVNEALQLIASQPSGSTDTATIAVHKTNTPNPAINTESFVIEIYVQIGAYRSEVNTEIYNMFKNIAGTNNITTVQRNNLIIYRIGPLQSKATANEVRITAVEAGITDAFIVAYKNGKQIPLREIND